MRLGKLFNRVLPLALTLTLFASLPAVTVQAAGSLGVNAASGGSVGAGNDPNYAAKFHAYPQNQGIRMAIVDKDGERVSNVVDIVNYVPSSLLNAGSFGANSGVVTNRYSGSEAAIASYTQKFMGWIGWKKEGSKRDYFSYSNGLKTERYGSNAWSLGVESGVPDRPGKYGVSKTIMVPRTAFNENLLDTIRRYAAKQGKTVAEAKLRGLSARMTIPSRLNDDGNFMPGGKYLKHALAYNITYMDGSESDYNLATYMTYMTVPKYDNKGNIAGSGGEYLFKLLPNAPSANKIGTKKPDGSTYWIYDAMIENNYSLIVEPVYWYVPEIVTTNANRINQTGTIHENYIDAVTYGTASYIARYAYAEMKLAGYNDDLIHDCSVGPDWGTGSLGITTMMVDKDDTDLGVYQCQEAHMIDSVYMA
jgi:hypothetical protein